MSRRVHLALWLVVASGGAFAQEAPYQEDLRFVRELRARRYNDLALEYLQQLAKNAPPELARELPLEVAKTRLEAAADEPDSARRLSLFGQAQEAFEKFLKDNPSHPRRGEVTLDLAQVAVMRGRTQLSRALLQDTPEGRDAEGAKAREILVKAAGQLKAAAAELDRQIAAAPDKTPEEIAAKKKLQEERLRAELSLALNLFDQGQTFSKTHADNKVLIERGGYIEKARKAFEKLTEGSANHPVTWQAIAWAGRCLDELGDPRKAREQFDRIQAGTADNPAAAEARRLAAYFRLLVIKESPDVKEKPSDLILTEGRSWLSRYPGFARTPEGYGMRYLLAETLAARAREAKNRVEKAADLDQARRLLREIEASENDFTDRARRLKVVIIGEQGGFTRPVKELATFDDCLVRAQYEIMQIGEDAKKLKGDELDKQRKARVATLLEALARGLAMPEAAKPGLETNNARALFAFYALNAGRYRDAIRIGEAFARNDPRSSQASLSAVYALEAYGQLLAERERAFATPEELKDDKEHMVALARYMQERWPRELAGDLARHQIALVQLREKEPNYGEAIAKLEALTPSYPSYALAQFQLAEAAFKAEREKVEPMPGDKPDGYHRRALAALERIAEPAAGAEPVAHRVFLEARVRLAREMFKAKKFDDMQKLAAALKEKLASGVRTDADAARDKAVRSQLAYEIDDVLLYARYGLAEAAFAGARYAEVAALLDPLVKEFNEGKLAPLRKNLPLGMAILGMALKADVQLGQLENTRAVLKALQALSAEGGAEAGTTAILSQLAVLIGQQIEDLRKKNSEAGLKKAVDSFSVILDDIVKQTKNPSPRFVLLLARCYSNMDQHKKAAELLEVMAEPKQPGPELDLYRGCRLMLVRELRLQKNVEKARALLAEILGTKAKPGWGARNINALKERVFLEEEEGKYTQAAAEANTLVRQLLPKASTDNALKEHYLECYYHIIYCFLKHAQEQDDPAKKEKLIKEAANQIVQLEKRWDGFGSDASKKRFEELLEKEPQLKEAYDKLKPAKGSDGQR
jgi:hypothetical protein